MKSNQMFIFTQRERAAQNPMSSVHVIIWIALMNLILFYEIYSKPLFILIMCQLIAL